MRLSTEWRFYFRGRKCPKMCLTIHWSVIIRDGPLENLLGWGGGGGGRSCTPINPKKNSCKEFRNEKNSCGTKIPLPRRITFLMVRP